MEKKEKKGEGGGKEGLPLPHSRVEYRLVALWGGASQAFLLLALLLHLVSDTPPVAAILTPSFLGYALSSYFALSSPSTCS